MFHPALRLALAPDRTKVARGIRLLLRSAERAGSALRSVLDDLRHHRFPSDCRVCNGPLLRARRLPICERCRVAVPSADDAAVRALRRGAGYGERSHAAPAEGLLCHPCRAVPPMFERAVAYAVYENEVREMIHLLKYERMGGVAKLLGGLLAEAILTLRAEAAKELIVVAGAAVSGEGARSADTTRRSCWRMRRSRSLRSACSGVAAAARERRAGRGGAIRAASLS